MIYYDRTDTSERIDVNETNESKECDLCHYWYFLDEDFKFQTYICNDCQDLLMMSRSLDDAISDINDIDYRCIISRISKSEAVNLLRNANLSEKSGKL